MLKAQSPQLIAQSSQLKSQSSLLKAQSRNEKIRVNSRDTWKRKERILSVSESFYIFVAEFRNKLKKGGNGKQKICNLDLVF